MTGEAKSKLEEASLKIGEAAFAIGESIGMLEEAKRGMTPGTYESLGIQHRIKELVNEQEDVERTILELSAVIPK